MTKGPIDKFKCTSSVLAKQLVSLFVNFFFDVDLLDFNSGIASIFVEDIARRQTMLILASIATISTGPVPPIFTLFNGLKEELAHNLRLRPLDVVLLLIADHLVELFLRQIIQVLGSDLVHYKLCPLIDVQVDFFVPVQSQIVGVNALLAFLA